MQKIKEFKFENYIPKTGRRGMDCVHYEAGQRIITDGRYLIALESNHPAELEGVSIRANYTIEPEPYPKYQRILPELSVGYEERSNIPEIAYKQKYSYIKIIDNNAILGIVSSYILNIAIEFQRYYKSSLFTPTDNEQKPWVLKAGKNLMVFQPANEVETFCTAVMPNKLILENE